MDNLLFHERVLAYFALASSLAAILTVPALLYIIRVHLDVQGILWSIKSVFSSFNVALLGLAISITGLCAANGFAISSPSVRVNIGPIQAAFASLYHTFYVMYSYSRGKKIIRLYLPKLERVMKVICHIIPPILLAALLPQIAATILSAMRPGNSRETALDIASRALSAGGSFLTIILDVILLAGFSKGMGTMGLNPQPDADDIRLIIISKYGIWVIVVYFMSTATFVASLALPLGVYSDTAVELSQTFLFCVYLILFAMKVALQKNVKHASTICPPPHTTKASTNHPDEVKSCVEESIEISSSPH